MYLNKQEVDKYIRALKKRKQLFENNELAIYIGKQSLKVMKRIARKYAREATWANSLPPRIYGRI